jgi:hypothetical protein
MVLIFTTHRLQIQAAHLDQSSGEPRLLIIAPSPTVAHHTDVYMYSMDVHTVDSRTIGSVSVSEVSNTACCQTIVRLRKVSRILTNEFCPQTMCTETHLHLKAATLVLLMRIFPRTDWLFSSLEISVSGLDMSSSLLISKNRT